MILRRYGTSVHSVVPNFDSKALTEIGFRRDQKLSQPTDEFEASHQRVRDHGLAATADGYVHDEVERALLTDLESQLGRIEEELGEDEVLLIESEQGTDYPKTRTQQKTVVIEGENRLNFITTVHPPLRVAVYRRGGASR